MADDHPTITVRPDRVTVVVGRAAVIRGRGAPDVTYTYATGPDGQLFVVGNAGGWRKATAVLPSDARDNPHARQRCIRRVQRALGRPQAIAVPPGSLADLERSLTP